MRPSLFIVCPPETNNPNSRKYTNSWKVGDVSKCPRQRTILTEDGELIPVACGRRCCCNLGCQERWCLWETRLLLEAHRMSPFSSRIMFNPPVNYTGIQRAVFIRKLLKRLQRWVRKNNKEYADISLFPHKTKRSRLHWDGVARLSLLAEKRLRELWRAAGGSVHGGYSIKPLVKVSTQIGYSCGRWKCWRSIIVNKSDGGVLIKSGKPYYDTKKKVRKDVVQKIKEWVEKKKSGSQCADIILEEGLGAVDLQQSCTETIIMKHILKTLNKKGTKICKQKSIKPYLTFPIPSAYGWATRLSPYIPLPPKDGKQLNWTASILQDSS